jgi:DNA-binding transcriptional LysR family regulator
MEFDDIRAFVAVAEARSVSRATRELYLTQPAVIRRVQRLESALGVTLCDRRRRPFALTEAGQAVLERCRHVLHAVQDVRSATGGDRPAREVRIGVAHALTEVTLTQLVDCVRRAFPRVALCLSTGWSHGLLERVRAHRDQREHVLHLHGALLRRGSYQQQRRQRRSASSAAAAESE